MDWQSIPVKDRSCEFLRDPSIGELGSVGKLSAMKDIYQGETVYIVSCGPSLATLESESLITSLRNNPVMTIKQAFGKMFGHSDVHHFNCNNFTQYDTPSSIVIASSSSAESSMAGGAVWGDARYDIFCKVKGGGANPTLCSTLDFDNNTFDKTGCKRMWGPGTLFETTLFTAVHAGASKICLIGVDLGPSDFEDSGTSLGHFYDSEGDDEIRGSAGILFKGENELTKEGFSAFQGWLSSRGIDLEICSRDSHLPASIPRNLWLYPGGGA
jgi:hypothetical protein